MSDGPKLLVTGFGPFPGAPVNPTETLMRALQVEAPASFGAADVKAVVLPTDYRRSWAALTRLYARFAPDAVVHFGVSRRCEAIHVERLGRNVVDPNLPDAAGFAPPSGRARRSGPDRLHATLPVAESVAALSAAGFPAAVSDDAGAYVCNATLYRSLHAEAAPQVGFVHVPPQGQADYTADRLAEAALVLLRSVITTPPPSAAR